MMNYPESEKLDVSAPNPSFVEFLKAVVAQQQDELKKIEQMQIKASA